MEEPSFIIKERAFKQTIKNAETKNIKMLKDMVIIKGYDTDVKIYSMCCFSEEGDDDEKIALI